MSDYLPRCHGPAEWTQKMTHCTIPSSYHWDSDQKPVSTHCSSPLKLQTPPLSSPCPDGAHDTFSGYSTSCTVHSFLTRLCKPDTGDDSWGMPPTDFLWPPSHTSQPCLVNVNSEVSLGPVWFVPSPPNMTQAGCRPLSPNDWESLLRALLIRSLLSLRRG